MRAIGLGVLIPLALAACSGSDESVANHNGATMPAATPPPAVPVRTALATDAWLGKWVGVEGLALTILQGEQAGLYRLHIALLDGAGDYDGTADGDVIRFMRDDPRHRWRGDGAEVARGQEELPDHQGG